MISKNRNILFDNLYQAATFDEVYNICHLLKFSGFYINKFYQRYQECKDKQFSLDSLKDKVWFLHKLYPPITYKSITVADSGLFYFEFYIKEDKYTLKFKGSNEIDCVKNKKETKTFTVANLNMNLFMSYIYE